MKTPYEFLQDLRQLHELLQKGHISEVEFQSQKEKLLIFGALKWWWDTRWNYDNTVKEEIISKAIKRNKDSILYLTHF